MRNKNGFATRRLSCERLDARHMMAADLFQESESNNTESTANRFELVSGGAVRLQGTSQNKDDKDYFTFTAPVDMRVAVATQSAAGAKLEVSTRSGSQLFESEPKDGLTAGAWQARAGESYLLRMRAPDKSAASYDVHLEASLANPGSGGSNGSGNSGGNTGSGSDTSGAEVEPNDRPALASRIGLDANQPITLAGSASKRDRDFFRVEVAQSGAIQVDTGDSDIKVSIETLSGIKLFESEPRDGVTTGSIVVSTGDVLLVRARGTASSVAQYSVGMRLVASSGTTTGSNSSSSGLDSSAVRDVWLDSSDDGLVSPLDALLVINHINAHGQGHSSDDGLVSLDTNDDGLISALDVLQVVNRVNQHGINDVNDAFDDSDIRRRTRA